MSITEAIRKQGHGSRVAIREGDLELTFDELFAAVDQVRQQLQDHPAFTTPEVPRIGVRFPNGLGYIVVALAVLEAGACFVPIPDELTEPERQQLVRETALHAVVSCEPIGGVEVRLPLQLGKATLHDLDDLPVSFPEQEFNALKPAFIRFSSGTTAA
ncbi:MAG: AMP-binding protein, partial [Verrucomicrobiae bacterium]|nr:AMP-binding protein [Verrucomicrobiae bacterium]NNJ87493.1 AMP-binding protein [Akkermansiaceae bacterium]